MNQESDNGFNNFQGNNGFINNTQELDGNILNGATGANNLNNIYGNQNALNTNFESNTNNYVKLTNEITSTNPNLENRSHNSNGISKKGKVMMFLVLFCTLIIFFDNFITFMDWFWELQWRAIMNNDDQLSLVLQTFGDLIVVVNWLIVLIITILSVIFLKTDKKKEKDIQLYTWYITAGVLHIVIGTVGLTPIIYSVATLVYAFKNKKHNKANNLSVNSDNVLVIFSSIIIVSIIFMFVAIQVNLFDKIENKLEDYQENREVVIEDKDNSHIITTFDKLLDDWGNDITKNKSYKIQNVKLDNITASLYVDYTFKLENENPISTITIKHGDNEIYTYTEKYNYFNLSHLKPYDNLIIYGTNYCDNVDNGICNKHLTYSQVLAFNKDDSILLYDKTIISQGGGITFHRDTSVFSEDEYVYAEPYNDFRVYDIKINNNSIYFYTIVENYDDIFRDNNCNDKFWVSIDFDMQRTFKTNFIYNESYKTYELGELIKQGSIKYADYCVNKNVLGF